MIKFTNFIVGTEDKTEIYDGKVWVPFITFTKKFQPRSITTNGRFARIITSGSVTIDFRETSKFWLNV